MARPAGAQDAPAELLFSDLELLVVYATKLPRTPKPKTLKAAVPVVAVGYRNWKPPPGQNLGGLFLPRLVRLTWRKSRNGRTPCSVQRRTGQAAGVHSDRRAACGLDDPEAVAAERVHVRVDDREPPSRSSPRRRFHPRAALRVPLPPRDDGAPSPCRRSSEPFRSARVPPAVKSCLTCSQERRVRVRRRRSARSRATDGKRRELPFRSFQARRACARHPARSTATSPRSGVPDRRSIIASIICSAFRAAYGQRRRRSAARRQDGRRTPSRCPGGDRHGHGGLLPQQACHAAAVRQNCLRTM